MWKKHMYHFDVYLQLTQYCRSCMHACSVSRVQFFVTLWIVVHQAPLSMGLSWQEYWSWLPFPSPGDLPNPGIKSQSPKLQVGSLLSETSGRILEDSKTDKLNSKLYRAMVR